MKLQFLDQVSEEEAKCLLCKATLRSYVESLGEDFQDYFVQRAIVQNKFLDQIWDTISRQRHIPTIVLVADEDPSAPAALEYFDLAGQFKVLDGLQRSNRLSIIWKTIFFLEGEFQDDSSVPPTRMARKYSEHLRKLECAPSLFVKMLEAKRKLGVGESLAALFDDNHIWLEIWVNLSQSEQIRKMLILNAGHKSVNIKHQIELLFIEYLSVLKGALPNSTIFREKEISAQRYSKERQPRQFHFAHLIASFESLNLGKPITTNSEFSASHSFPSDEDDTDELLRVDEGLISQFARTLSRLDAGLSTKAGIGWLSREVVLVGLFGAIGRYGREHRITSTDALKYFEENVSDYIASLDLEAFEKVRNSLELSKVNIGTKNKRAVYDATLEFLEAPSSKKVDWQRHFGV
ncbi:hypothetical protein GRI42_13730 [Erythrobacter gaetbuli]|uniref:DUF262 domain-containing protein n=1 Tax=Qipengyuania gaetbuli TaxID=266952 RepID=A0A844Y3G3_9SPHN|nr:hypothetical protein [Qipengyuania gaetbuli]MXO52366.1 hypothetical protein [Qipengyuania gaetbuli]